MVELHCDISLFLLSQGAFILSHIVFVITKEGLHIKLYLRVKFRVVSDTNSLWFQRDLIVTQVKTFENRQECY